MPTCISSTDIQRLYVWCMYMFVHALDVRRKWILRGKPMTDTETPNCWLIFAVVYIAPPSVYALWCA